MLPCIIFLLHKNMSRSSDISCTQCIILDALANFQQGLVSAFPGIKQMRNAVMPSKAPSRPSKQPEEVSYQALFSWEPSEWEELDNLDSKLDGSFSTVADEEDGSQDNTSSHLMSILQRLNMEEQLTTTHI